MLFVQQPAHTVINTTEFALLLRTIHYWTAKIAENKIFLLLAVRLYLYRTFLNKVDKTVYVLSIGLVQCKCIFIGLVQYKITSLLKKTGKICVVTHTSTQ